jgi:hypothetical protein
MAKDWSPLFGPSYTPEEMLRLGVFEGKYINNIKGIPPAWKRIDKVLGPNERADPSVNKYGVKSRQPLSTWQEKEWIGTDRNGWFEWYILYHLGRRLGAEDLHQIGRWRSFVARHQGQITASCKLNDEDCHARQRQGLLQWAWDSASKFEASRVSSNAERAARLSGSSIAMESVSVVGPLPKW